MSGARGRSCRAHLPHHETVHGTDPPAIRRRTQGARRPGRRRRRRAVRPRRRATPPRSAARCSASRRATSSRSRSGSPTSRSATSSGCSRARTTRCASAPSRSWTSRRARSARTTAHREALYDLYLRRHDRIDNWDLVDRAAPHVVGGWLADKPRDVLYELAKSASPNERRTAIVATWFFIRADDVDDTFRSPSGSSATSTISCRRRSGRGCARRGSATSRSSCASCAPTRRRCRARCCATRRRSCPPATRAKFMKQT